MTETEDLADEVISRFKDLPSRIDLEKVKAYARAYTEYTLSRVADNLDRESQFSAGRAIRDKVDEIKADNE